MEEIYMSTKTWSFGETRLKLILILDLIGVLIVFTGNEGRERWE